MAFEIGKTYTDEDLLAEENAMSAPPSFEKGKTYSDEQLLSAPGVAEQPAEQQTFELGKSYTDEQLLSFSQAKPKPVAPEVPEDSDIAITRGVKKAGSALGFAADITTGDYEAAAENIVNLQQYIKENPASQEAQELSLAWESGEGVAGGLKEVAGEFKRDIEGAPTPWGAFKSVAKNVKALGAGVIEQIPYMAAPVAGAVAGEAAGAAAGSAVPLFGTAAGSLVGMITGASAGNAMVEAQGIAIGEMNKAGINLSDENAVATFLEENSSDLLKKSAGKGAILGTVDALTLKLGSFLLRGPGQKAAKKALTDMGVDVADKAAVKVATATPDFKTRLLADKVFLASEKGLEKTVRNVSAAAIEPLGEGLGEYLGSGIALGDWDVKNATLEAMASIGQSAMTFGGQKALQAAARVVDYNSPETTTEERNRIRETQGLPPLTQDEAISAQIDAEMNSLDVEGEVLVEKRGAEIVEAVEAEGVQQTERDVILGNKAVADSTMKKLVANERLTSEEEVYRDELLAAKKDEAKEQKVVEKKAAEDAKKREEVLIAAGYDPKVLDMSDEEYQALVESEQKEVDKKEEVVKPGFKPDVKAAGEFAAEDINRQAMEQVKAMGGISIESAKQMFSGDTYKQLSKPGLFTKTGQQIDDVATQLGYESANDLVDAWGATPLKKKSVAEAIREQQTEFELAEEAQRKAPVQEQTPEDFKILSDGVRSGEYIMSDEEIESLPSLSAKQKADLLEVNNEVIGRFSDQINAVVKNKKQADAITSLVKARAVSAGMNPSEYLKSRGIQVIADSAGIGTEAERQANKGAVDMSEEGQAIIHAFSSADISTMVHELGHIFRRDLSGKELDTATDWATKDGTWNRAAEEKFARGWEKYITTGQAPNAELKGLFEKFKNWMLGVYKSLSHPDIDIDISPEIRGVFDSLVSGEAVGEAVDVLMQPESSAQVETYYAGTEGEPYTKIHPLFSRDYDNYFGGIFATNDIDVARSFGDTIQEIKVDTNKLTSLDEISDLLESEESWRESLVNILPEKPTNEELDELIEYITDEKDIFSDDPDMGSDRLSDFLIYEDVGEQSWRMQGLVGELARINGYDAVEMPDEQGVSTLILNEYIEPEVDVRADPVEPDVLFQQAGIKSKTANTSALHDATQRLESGDNPEQIRQETGWHLGVDKKWRYEIDDSEAFFAEFIEGRRGKLGQFLKHSELYKAYPELKKLEVGVSNMRKGMKGKYVPDAFTGGYIRIASGRDEAEKQKTLMHEVQHAIQYIEGFSEGGSPDNIRNEEKPVNPMWKKWKNDPIVQEFVKYKTSADYRSEMKAAQEYYTDIYKKKIDKISSKVISGLISNKEGEQLEKSLKRDYRSHSTSTYPLLAKVYKLSKSIGDGLHEPKKLLSPFETYQRLFGEIEARDTAERINMTVEDRKREVPYVGQGIPMEQAIVRYVDEKPVSEEVDVLMQAAPLTPEQQDYMDTGGFGVRPKKTIKQRFDETKVLATDKLRQGVVDQFHSLRSILKDDTAWMMSHLTKSDTGVLMTAINQGMPVWEKSGAIDIKPGSKSLKGILAPLGENTDRFFAWVAANRAERLSAEDRENLFTDKQIAAGKTLNKGLEDVFNTARDEFEELGAGVTDIAVKTGLVNAKEAQQWEKEGFYVPFYRMLEDQTTGSRGPSNIQALTNQKAYKKLKGGKSQLEDLLTNTLSNWNHLISAGLRNQAGKKALETAESMGLATQVPKALKSKNAIYVRDNGQEVWYEIDGSPEGSLVLDSLMSLNYEGMNNVAMKSLRMFKRALTSGVTASPGFKIRNLIRDSLHAPAVSTASKNPLKNIAVGIKDRATMKRMEAGGGAFSQEGYIYGSDPDAIKRLVGVSRETILNTPGKVKRLWRKYENFGNMLENINRVASFQKDIAAGKTLLEANFNSRDQMDFARSGSFPAVRMLAQTVPFFNARLQGLDKLGRSVMDKDQRRQFAQVVGMYSLASVALMLAMKDDEDYEEAEDWEKRTYHMFKVPGSDQMYRIPRPFEVGAIAFLTEQMTKTFLDENEDIKGLGLALSHTLTDTLAMNPIPQAFKPLIELYSNKSMFTGRDIETAAMKRLSKKERFQPWTSQTAQGFSAGMSALLPESVTLSPVQTQHLVRAYTGWAGSQILAATDFIVKKMTGQVDPEVKISEYKWNPVESFSREKEGRSTKYVTRFYENMDILNREWADIQRYRETGSGEKISAAVSKRARLRKRYNRISKRLSKLRKREKRIFVSKTMTATAKRAAIAKLRKQKNFLTKRMVILTRDYF